MHRDLSRRVRCCLRDPRSARRLRALTGRRYETTADLAFLVEPEPETGIVRDASSWIRRRRGSGALFVGVNANYLHATLGLDALVGAYVRECDALLREIPALHLVLIPHDRRGDPGDGEILESVRASLSPEHGARVYSVPGEASPGEVKAV